MVTVEQAEQLILERLGHWGHENIAFEESLGRVLAQPVIADRDMPPYNRVMMDGIAIRFQGFENGSRSFAIKGMQPAGSVPLVIPSDTDCIEIMTGAALPDSADTVVRYEDLEIRDGIAHLTSQAIRKGQYIHIRGSDKKQSETIVEAGTRITPAIINTLATVGQSEVLVKKLPSVAVVSSGDELKTAEEKPDAFEIRASNSYAARAMLRPYSIDARILHVPDGKDLIRDRLAQYLSGYDCLIISGGVSMGKLDHIPRALEELGVHAVFHKVQQRPGKPFWFGTYNNKVPVFAFPGNPVSTFLCMHRYFLPWLEASLGLPSYAAWAVLGADTTFTAPLQYFIQVLLAVNQKGLLEAFPREGNGSGDLANLVSANAFMELPAKHDTFSKGSVYRVWPFINLAIP